MLPFLKKKIIKKNQVNFETYQIQVSTAESKLNPTRKSDETLVKRFFFKKNKIKIFEVSNFETHHKEGSNAKFDAETYKRNKNALENAFL